jgi:ABC-type multidrug transport system ATPase subunit
VGAGFHPELTGKENIYLNSTIMGLKKKEIDKKYNDIVSFAELKEFMDTPVKRYSSGMYVRLGFAVVANIDPDIFLIDEILSVGDLSFQRKCLDTMSRIRKSDKAIVFVSHNLSAIRGLCDRVIWLNKGQIEEEGKPDSVINAYVKYMTSKSTFLNDTSYVSGKTRWGTGEVCIEKVKVFNSNNEESDKFSFGEEMRVRLEFKTDRKIESPIFWIGIMTDNEIRVVGTYYNKDRVGPYMVEGKGALECIFKNLSLRPGVYHLMVGAYDEYGLIAYDRIGRVHTFKVENNYSDGFEAYKGYGAEGIVDFANAWKMLNR